MSNQPTNNIKDKFDKYPVFKLRNKLIDEQREISNNFLGKVLTIIDASIQDLEQKKAIKDLIKSAFWDNTKFNSYCKTTIYDFFDKYGKDFLPESKEDKLALKGMEI